MEKLAELLNVDIDFIYPAIKISQEEKKELLNYYERIDKYYFRKNKIKKISNNTIYTNTEKKENKKNFKIKDFIKKIIDLIKRLVFQENR